MEKRENSKSEETEVILDALVGCVMQGCESHPNVPNVYGHSTLSAYEDALDVLEKYGQARQYKDSIYWMELILICKEEEKGKENIEKEVTNA